MSASSREPPSRSRPSPGGWLRKRPIAPATSTLRIRRATTEGVRKLSLRKLGEGGADPVLVAGNDRGVRDGEAERVAEQGGHREPVGDAADQPGLGEGADEAPGGMQLDEAGGGDEHRRHAGQHRRGEDPHAAGAALRRVETAKARPVEEAHAGSITGGGHG